ncbi:hypothetical protein CBS115989_5780 [Aspergillus niger]|uniref:Uncharacterized protein n=3 Tax=Aspergillus niger TaxID=5061 RepID=A2QMR8_ASPNC|nr:hypothetical protein An07g03080 [Aspergillus niger]RDH16623.1 hypothetical protein M747DRAFT_298609 [Aspergillus niger ATCC 13496]KAI2817705.1 hypothetical protein CBS115989_5780 [Aspergillus niger]KAI2853929.1 hypothetical protein CBS11232_5241 [Aspergillus niger]KAI2874865.1 hypothetical protein CBS115988_5883 [Aspergillus niger]KAI2898294.1 hypothetical protein CBS11852_3668 [Aspergillus niger]|eukprot:XP_001391391.1 hypothetical protein ANI_1_1634064 [Aspergillus niger CBS 513.88]
MNSARPSLRHLAQAVPALRPAGAFHIPTTQLHYRLQSTSSRSIPRFAQTSIWTSMIPKFIRNRGAKETKPYKPKSKEWNPASFYIIIFILIGSQAIRMIALKNDYAAYTRSTDAKIRLLREVIEKVNNGEKVDVEKLLGTGDEAKEREWEEVLREIEAEDSLWHRKAAASEAQQEQVEEPKQSIMKSIIKEPAVPAEGPRDQGLPADSPSKKKLNFF